MKNIKLIDNSSAEFQLGNIMKQLITDSAYSEVSIATGYWDLPGMSEIYRELLSFFERGNTKLRLLLGEEPSVKAYQVKNPVIQDPDFPEKYLKNDLENLQLKEEFQQVADLLGKYLNKENTGRFQIKVYRKNFLHAKCYIFGTDKENAVGIIGSSNFTRQGLFGNLELNQFENNNSTVNFIRKDNSQFPSHRSWFEDLWDNSEDWSQTFKEEILALSKHGGLCYSPYEMYIHALYRIYGQDLMDEKENKIIPDNPDSGKPHMLKFQIQNANRLIKKLDMQGVAMLSDSVGMGKTYTAIKVIEYFMFNPEKNQRVVVITPASLIQQWKKAFDDFRMIHKPEIYSLQNIHEIEDVKKNLKSIPVGLFVFDESHNLRSSGGERFEAFITWKQENKNAKTLLVTATPINNQLSDLTRQIELGSGGDIYKLGRFYDRSSQKYYTLKERIEFLQKNIKSQIHNNKFINYEQLKEQLTPLLNRFFVRRTRQGIEKEYPDGLKINGQLRKFPESHPDNLEYKVPNEIKSKLLEIAERYPELTKAYRFEINSLAEMEYLAHPLDLFEHYTPRAEPIKTSLEIVYTALLGLGFPCYRYNVYRYRYYNKKREELKLNDDDNLELNRQTGIYGIFRTVFLKRMESSFFSIKKSIENYEGKLIDFQTKLDKYNKIISVKNLTALNKFLEIYNEQKADEDQLDFVTEEFETLEKEFIDADNGVFHIEQLKSDIQKDLSIIGILKEQLALLISKDDKIQILANHLNRNEDRKVLVFTYFADTLEYLSKNLPQLVKAGNLEFATGTKNEIENYARRFAPVSKQYEMHPDEKEIDFLVATDKLSEGQNLQDCGMIVNYDLHWNPVRMIQRNGRINRLGTKHKEIFVFNFRPTEQLESYLRLVSKLQSKIDLIRYTVGSDQSVLDEEPIPQDFTENLYSHDEKKRHEAMLKILEKSELLAAEDLFMDDLRQFDRSEDFDAVYKDKIKNLPKGKWGTIPKNKGNNDFRYLAHFIDKDDCAGYFFSYDESGIIEHLPAAEGLLHIQTTSENNKRLSDTFKNKPKTEEMILSSTTGYTIDDGINHSSVRSSHQEVLNFITEKMIEYGYVTEKIERLVACANQCQNTYINDKLKKLLRQINKLRHHNTYVDSSLFDKLVQYAEQWIPDEKKEVIPVHELIQIFTV